MNKISRALFLAILFISLTCAASAPIFAQAEKGNSTTAQPQATPMPAPKMPAGAGGNAPQKITKEGIEVEFTIEPVASKDKAQVIAGEEALVRFKITDTATKTPVGGVNPSAWITQLAESASGDAKACHERISSYLQGSLRSRPDVDLNSYFVLALNEEANISVIDPLLGFGGSKLLTLVMLKSPGEDWALSSDRETLFVSLPLVGQIAVVDTTTWKVTDYIDAGARPMRIALQPDGKYLWVANDAQAGQVDGATIVDGVTVIDATTRKMVMTIPTGAGHHELAFSDDSRFAFVTNRQSGTLSVIEVAKLAKLKDVKTGAAPVSLAFSPLSRAVYVGSETDGVVTVVDSRTQQVLANMQARAGLKTLRIEPKGRYGLITNSKENLVHVFDASTNRLVHNLNIGKAPDQIAFSDAFAYIRSAGTDDVAMIRLVTLDKQPDITHFPGGQMAPNQASSSSLADSIFPAPEGNSMLVANAADGVIYYYTEGMAAPMGNFQNYRRQPRSVRVVDRNLRETAPGVYTTNVKLPKSGNFDVAFLLDSPRITHCFETSAKENPALKTNLAKAPVKLEYLVKDYSITVNKPQSIRFKLTDAATGQPKSDLKDIRVLTFLAPGIWQKRDFARSIGEGVYEINITVPQTGFYMIFIESRTLGFGFRDMPHLSLQAMDAPATAEASGQSVEAKKP